MTDLQAETMAGSETAPPVRAGGIWLQRARSKADQPFRPLRHKWGSFYCRPEGLVKLDGELAGQRDVPSSLSVIVTSSKPVGSSFLPTLKDPLRKVA
jgi:hypothetical protein